MVAPVAKRVGVVRHHVDGDVGRRGKVDHCFFAGRVEMHHGPPLAERLPALVEGGVPRPAAVRQVHVHVAGLVIHVHLAADHIGVGPQHPGERKLRSDSKVHGQLRGRNEANVRRGRTNAGNFQSAGRRVIRAGDSRQRSGRQPRDADDVSGGTVLIDELNGGAIDFGIRLVLRRLREVREVARGEDGADEIAASVKGHEAQRRPRGDGARSHGHKVRVGHRPRRAHAAQRLRVRGAVCLLPRSRRRHFRALPRENRWGVCLRRPREPSLEGTLGAIGLPAIHTGSVSFETQQKRLSLPQRCRELEVFVRCFDGRLDHAAECARDIGLVKLIWMVGHRVPDGQVAR